MRVRRLFLCGLAASTLLAVRVGHAATVTMDPGSPAVYNVIGTPSTIGTQGWELFSTADPNNEPSPGPGGTNVGTPLPGYVATLVPSANNYFSPGNKEITAGGNTYATGVVYTPAPGVGTIATITLANTGLPTGGFKLGLLGDNVDVPGSGVSLTVSGTNGVTQLQDHGSLTDRFYFYDLTDLHPGDVITITGLAGPNSATIGGITFDALPEPASLSLLLPGALMLARRKRGA